MTYRDLQEAPAAKAPVGSSTLQALIELAGRLGINCDEAEICRRYTISDGELPTRLVIAIAKDLGLEARSVRVKFSDLLNLSKTLPALLRSKDMGALILESIRADPLKGTIAVVREPKSPLNSLIVIDEARLADIWEGEVVLFKRRYMTGDETQPFGLPWLVSQVLRERKLLVDISMAAIVNTIFALAPAFIMIIVINRVLVNHSFSTLNVIAGAVILIIIFETVLGYLRRLMMQVATTRIDGRINLYMMEKVLNLPLDYFERNATGLILSKLGKLGQIRRFLTGQLLGAFLDAVPLIGLVPALLILQWQLALFVFTMTAVIAFIVYFFMKPIGKRHNRLIIAEQKRNAHLVETIHGMRTVKSLALEGRRRHDWDLRVAESTAADHDLRIMANYPQTLTQPFERLIYSGALILGAYTVLYAPDAISVGSLVAFSMLSMRLTAPLIQVARLQQDLAEAQGAVGEAASILNSQPEESRLGTGLRMPISGEIRFQDVSFRYAAGSPLALDRVNITIPKGKMLGVMGRSGSGKTTITRLLQGLHSSYEGMIKIDGMDLREIELAHLRTNIGVVPQENFLFSGSIRENIGMARPNATFADIVRAAQLAGAEEFIERLPRGYDTKLEEGAVNLSGGQRQRLAIARALLIDPPVLILDEATSALDAESEAIVNANLRRIAKGRTVISISHRLSMLVEADAILVLERGKVYDIGTHEELMERCDIYQHLWYQQNRHLEPKDTEIAVVSSV